MKRSSDHPVRCFRLLNLNIQYVSIFLYLFECAEAKCKHILPVGLF